MEAIVTFVDGSTITVPDSATAVTSEIQRMATGYIGERSDPGSISPPAYGDWLMLGDKDETYFNPAHVMHVRDKKSSTPMVAIR